MFSRELAELDRNTVQYMIDEMQDKIDAQEGKLQEKDQTIEKKDQTIHAQSQQREKSIQNLIQSLKAQNRADSEILKMLGDVFGLTAEEAEARLR